MEKIRVNLKNNFYEIVIGFNIIRNIGAYINKIAVGNSPFIITSPKIGKLYAELLVRALRKHGFKNIKIAYVPDGERYKNWNSYKNLLEELISFDTGFDKKVFVINLGGGLIGDIGGFVSATYRRGIDYIQIPTTLLACVDSGVGGKVGIDFKNVKNALGSFHQPKMVFADLSLLKTLPERDIKSGLAEVVKYGIIEDKDMFTYLEGNCDKILEMDKNSLMYIICNSYRIKARIVEKDEKDKIGIRAKLNYGHTIGHAVEAASEFVCRHGEAISIGMVCENDISFRLNLIEKNVCSRIENLLIKIGLPVKIKNCELDDIMKYFWHDKKFIHGRNRLALARDIGKVEIVEDISLKIIKEVLKKRKEN